MSDSSNESVAYYTDIYQIETRFLWEGLLIPSKSMYKCAENGCGRGMGLTNK
jgi:hypothetical protein